MLEKINSKKKLLFHCFIVSLFLVLVYSRFVGLDWGLPYPMHPDERNMANAIQTLNCKFSIFNFQFSNLRECFNPHFFAYGQFPLYLGYLIVYFLKFFDGDMGFPISFQEAAISLRIISAVASIINVFVLIKIIGLISNIKDQILNIHIKNQKLLILLVLIFSPFFIQFSHFGTTESLLMLFYSLIVYLSMQMLERRTTASVVRLALVSGLAMATKISSVLFLAVPMTVFILNIKNQKLKLHIKIQKFLIISFCFIFCTSLFAIFFSPHNLINFQGFINAIRYESDVAFGKTLVFYTRQFVDTVPILFQLVKVFPYSLGLPLGILGGLGILGLGWKDKKINLLRFAFLIYFIPSAIIYAKWSRFMAPVFPIILIFAVLLILNIKDKISKIQIKNQKFYILICHFAFYILIFLMIIPGIAYLSIYQKPDVRFQASNWIYKNIPNNSYILSETANVVDIPINNGTRLRSSSYDGQAMEQLNNYNIISFNFYDLDESPELQSDLRNHLQKADYIFVPSRRIFANHTCQGNFQFSIFNFQSNLKSKCQILKNKYPVLNKYYEDLFNGKLGFEKVAEFSSGLNDEAAEETWTVFDHPVIRIYKKVK